MRHRIGAWVFGLAILGAGTAGVAQPERADAGQSDGAPMAEPLRADLKRTVPAGLPVDIDNAHGDVHLRFGGYGREIEIHSVAQYPQGRKPPTVDASRQGERFRIAPRFAAGAPGAPGAGRMDLTVYLPKGYPLSVRTTDGTIAARGLQSDVTLRSERGDLLLRGTRGAIDARTQSGSIDVTLEPAPSGARQHLSTTTGAITVAVTDALDAEVQLATSGVFGTEYSLDVTHLRGEEPNKSARTTIGSPVSSLAIQSRRGEIRLLRNAAFTPASAVGGTPVDTSQEGKRKADAR